MTKRFALLLMMVAVNAGLVASPAMAFDPFEGANDNAAAPEVATPRHSVTGTRYSRSAPAPRLPSPARLTQPDGSAPAPQTPAKAPVPAPAPMKQAAPAAGISYAPAETPASAVSANAVAPLSSAYAAPQPSYQPADFDVGVTPAPMPIQSKKPARDSFSVAVESFYDRYQEESVDVDNRAVYGSLTLGYTGYFGSRSQWFAGTDLRVSYGQEDYKSPSGKIDGIDQWEVENRILGGYDIAFAGNRHIKPYTGFDTRYYRDEGKGKVTNLGANAYDRRILQMFVPVGLTYEFPAHGFTIAPTAEYAHLVFGRVESRLQNVPGFYEAGNYQHSGYGLRGEVMVRKLESNGSGWEFGPFIRYWHFNNSDIDTTLPTPQGNQWVEPDNNRIQAGAKLKYLF